MISYAVYFITFGYSFSPLLLTTSWAWGRAHASSTLYHSTSQHTLLSPITSSNGARTFGTWVNACLILIYGQRAWR